MKFALFTLLVLATLSQINFCHTASLGNLETNWTFINKEFILLNLLERAEVIPVTTAAVPLSTEVVALASSENLAANRRPTTTTPRSDQPWQDSFEFPPLPDCKKGNCHKKNKQLPRSNPYELNNNNNLYDQGRQLNDYGDSYPEGYDESVASPVDDDSYNGEEALLSDADYSNEEYVESDRQLPYSYDEAYPASNEDISYPNGEGLDSNGETNLEAYEQNSKDTSRQFLGSPYYGGLYGYGLYGGGLYGYGLYGGGLYGEATGESGLGEGYGYYGNGLDGEGANLPAFRNNPCRNGINSLRCILSRRGGFGLNYALGYDPYYYYYWFRNKLSYKII